MPLCTGESSMFDKVSFMQQQQSELKIIYPYYRCVLTICMSQATGVLQMLFPYTQVVGCLNSDIISSQSALHMNLNCLYILVVYPKKYQIQLEITSTRVQ